MSRRQIPGWEREERARMVRYVERAAATVAWYEDSRRGSYVELRAKLAAARMVKSEARAYPVGIDYYGPAHEVLRRAVSHIVHDVLGRRRAVHERRARLDEARADLAKERAALAAFNRSIVEAHAAAAEAVRVERATRERAAVAALHADQRARRGHS